MSGRTYGTIFVNDAGNTFEIECEAHVAVRLKRWFPKIPQGRVGRLTITATDENARDLQWFLDRFPMQFDPPNGLTRISRLARRFDERIALTNRIISGEYQPPEFKMALPPREYQARAASLALANGGLLVADELGLGKTITGLTMLADPRALPALIVVPPHLQVQWHRELARFLPALDVHTTKSTQAYPMRRLQPSNGQARLLDADRADLSTMPDVVITTYSKLFGWADYLAGVVKSVIFDEVQELRHAQSLKYTAAIGLAQATNFRMGLSATPIHNYGGEYFNVLEILQPGVLGGWPEFITEHCIGGADGRNWALKDPVAFGAMLRDQGFMVRRTRREVGRELPKVNQVIERVDADLAHLDAIDTAATELAKVILRSGGSNFAKFQAAEEFSMRMRMQTGIAKAPYVAAFVRMLVEQTGEPVILCGWHREVYRLWLDHLAEFKPAMYTGSETPGRKAQEVDRFLTGQTPILILSLRSGSGLDGLQKRCSRIVMGELDWSPAVHQQCIGRLHRDDQPEPVFSYFLLADAGSDPVVADVLGLKHGQQIGVLDPDRPTVVEKGIDPSHVKKLAAAYLKSKGIEAIEPEEDTAEGEPAKVAVPV